MTHILIVYKQFPGPTVSHAGGESVYRLMQALHARGHTLTLVARIHETERPQLPAVQTLCDRIVTVPHHRSLSGPRPLEMARSYWLLRQATRRTLLETRPDLLYVEFAQTGAVLLGLKGVPTAIRAHDINWFLMEQEIAQHSGLARWRSRLLRTLFLWLEPWLYRQFDLVAAISEGDRRLLAKRCAPKPILLLPLAPAFQPTPDMAPAVASGPNVLFVGAMSRAYNVQAVTWFLDDVWPTVLAQVPAARCYIVGAQPPPSIQSRHDGARVFVTGFVDDLAPWYQAAAVCVAPLLVAGGLLQKVIDALGMGVPVVATSASNHGVGATPDEHLLIADDPATFAAAVTRLLKDTTAREQLGRAGRLFVETRYNFGPAVARWEETVKNLV